MHEETWTWRKVAMDIAIIVAGVLIALGAEQAAQSVNDRQRTDAAEEAMALEISNSLLASAELIRLAQCEEVQIDALQQAIVRGDRGSASEIVNRGSVFGPGRLWADNAFEAALIAQVSDYLGAEKLKRYSQVYDMIRDARSAQEQRLDTMAELGTLSISGLPETPQITYSLLAALSRLRANRALMQGQGELIVMFAKNDLGLEVTRAEYLAARGRVEAIKACENDARLVRHIAA